MATRSTNPSTERGPVRQPLCPYLARFDAQDRQVAPVDYPSFENHCRAATDEPSLLLTDQATFCLSGSYRLCDRFQLVHLEEPPRAATPPLPRSAPPPVATLAEEPWTQPLFVDQETRPSYRPSRQIWAWASAAVIFAAVLLTGGAVAAYVGWELALQGGLLARNAAVNSIDTIASAANESPTPAFVVMTATSAAPPAPVVAAPPPAEGAAPANANPQAYPEAVTATPIVLTAPDSVPDTAANPPPVENPPPAVVLQPTFTETPVPPRNLVLPPATDATPTVFINVLQELPTVPERRPTPAFEVLPTDTLVPVTPTATPTLAPLGTPVVVFGPDESAVPPGECTRVRWHVTNVREVYYENLPSLGDGSREECIDKEPNTYALRIVLGDGQTKIYTTTLNVLWPTPTPTFTPSFTPEPVATETWTPQAPTATPTPNVIYAVALGIDGERQQGCTAGTDCTIGVLVTNMGDHPDTLSVEFLEKGAATARLCRQDGVCGEQKLTISNVGPTNTAFLSLRVSVPADSAGTTFSYVLRGVSDGSQGSMTSEAVKVEVTSQ